jgi:DNA-binding LacI/PurR family transcriptional regulator
VALSSIRELARLAGTSIASVSRVLNKRPGVNPETRARVEALVEQHGFRPNLLAKELLAKRTRLVGILLPTIHSYYAERIAGVTDVCREHRYSTLIASARENVDDELAAFRLFAEKQVEGILFFAASLDDRHREVLADLGQRLPIVCIGHETEGLPVSSVVSDNYGGALLALDHLTALGHQRVAFVGGPAANLSARQRALAFRRTADEQGWWCPPDWVREGDFNPPSGWAQTVALLGAGHGVPTAIFYGNDMMAFGGLKALAERGLSVPGDVSVVGFDDIPLAEYSLPGLTTVHQNHYDIGRRAGQLLLDHLGPGEPPARAVVLEQRLIVRASTAPPRQPA